jgi:diguanylate cyclase (GGDEF)-like protein
MSPTRLPTDHRPTVLVVDDVPSNLDVLVDHLHLENIELMVALSGEEGLNLARSERPDLILLDVMMPGMDGYEVCRRLKQDPQLSDIPVLFLTALGEEVDAERGFALGALDYIHKPFSLPLLKARMRNHLALKRKTDQLAELACTDGLTGIANRRHFDETCAIEWMRAQRNQLALAVIAIDVDHFKAYNDCYGHGEGDICLKRVAQALRTTIKRPGDLLARYGGEEFIALLPETCVPNALILAERLRLAVADLAIPHARSPVGAVVSISLGVASAIPERSGHVEALLRAADEQLYRAKHGGRNRVCQPDNVA